LHIEQRAQVEIASLVALVDAPLEIVENGAFRRLLNAFVDIGRQDPQFQFGGERCPLTRYRTRKTMIQESVDLSARLIRAFATRPCVSLAIDAGTIERRHFLNVMLLAPYSNLKPFLYDSYEEETLTSDDYGRVIAQIIKELKTKGVRVRSIVGDNLPAQVSALAHWSKRSCLKGIDPDLNAIKYSPCMCHFMQLVVGDLITADPVIQEFEAILQGMIGVTNSSEVFKILRMRCPQYVKTRWLSRSNVLSWLLSREEILLGIDPERLPKGRRSTFQELITSENFHKLSIYHRVLHPCVQAVKFFEQDHITLCHVYPTLKTLKRHLKQEEDPLSPDIYECLNYWRLITNFIQLRKCKLLDMDLVKVAFWLTSFGCTWLAKAQELIPESHQLHLQYEHPQRLAAHGPLDEIMAEVAPRSIPDVNDGDLPDCRYTGDSVTENSFENIPRLPVTSEKKLTFIQEVLVQFLLEQLPPGRSMGDGTDDPIQTEESIRSRVMSLISLFFCSDEYGSRCQDTQAGIDKQIELWNFLSRNAPGRPYDQVVERIIWIISIPASEASCERSFSAQKRIMGESRFNSNRDLLRARFLLQGRPDE
jgi:hypothetical protein